ncbi:response regulator [Patescibacteria group bacterium]|nr:response regulator [Patescibacteria group bacterium]
MHEKIILVEDDAEITEIYKLKFTLHNYDIITVGDGDLAIPKIRIELPDIILLDILLPNKDGFEILKEIKSDRNEEVRSIPVFILTNLSNNLDIQEAKKLGATEYIVKAKKNPSDIVSMVDAFFKKQRTK